LENYNFYYNIRFGIGSRYQEDNSIRIISDRYTVQAGYILPNTAKFFLPKLLIKAEGDFFTRLRDRELTKYLNCMLDSDAILHFTATNIVQWLADKLYESGHLELGFQSDFAFDEKTGDQLCWILENEIAATSKAFENFQRTQEDREAVHPLVSELKRIVDSYHHLPQFSYSVQRLSKLIARIKQRELQENYHRDFFDLDTSITVSMFLTKMQPFPTSAHYFLTDPEVKFLIDDFFKDPEPEPIVFPKYNVPNMISASDTMADLLIEASKYIAQHTAEEISLALLFLKPVQLKNLHLLRRLVQKTIEHDERLITRSDGSHNHLKWTAVFGNLPVANALS